MGRSVMTSHCLDSLASRAAGCGLLSHGRTSNTCLYFAIGGHEPGCCPVIDPNLIVLDLFEACTCCFFHPLVLSPSLCPPLVSSFLSSLQISSSYVSCPTFLPPFLLILPLSSLSPLLFHHLAMVKLTHIVFRRNLISVSGQNQ